MSSTAVSIVNSVGAPVTDGKSVRLPGGVTVFLSEDSPTAFWRLRTHGGIEQAFSILDPVLAPPTYSPDQEEVAMARLCSDRESRTIARYAGYLVDQLYLRPGHSDIAWAECAARVCRLFIRFWQDASSEAPEHATHALPLLWRCYWRALALMVDEADRLLQTADRRRADQMRHEFWRRMRTDRAYAWIVGWKDDLATEYMRARAAWLEICHLATYSWVFSEHLCVWLKRPRHQWQAIREAEVDRIIWRHGSLRPPGVVDAIARQRLETLIESWYLPRYDLWNATRIAWIIATAENDWMRRITILALGAERLWAGAAVGYISTMLQGDTWQALRYLNSGTLINSWLPAVTIMALTVVYFAYGVARRIGIIPWRRVLLFILKGEAVSLALAWGATATLAPLFLTPAPAGAAFWSIVFLYAQLALAIGVITQLLFSGKPATMPLAEQP